VQEECNLNVPVCKLAKDCETTRRKCHLKVKQNRSDFQAHFYIEINVSSSQIICQVFELQCVNTNSDICSHESAPSRE